MKTLIISDIHGNLAALDAILEQEPDSDEVMFLGDAVGAGPQPAEVMQRLSEIGGIAVMGNHDAKVLDGTISASSVDGRYMRWTQAQLSSAQRRSIARFEPTGVVERDGMVMRLHHGHFPKPLRSKSACEPAKRAPAARLESVLRWRPLRRIRRRFFCPSWDSRIWPDTPIPVFRAIAGIFPEPVVLLAHSHVQFEKKVDGTIFVNPGSVGQPRLGRLEGKRPLATYAVLEDGAIELRAAAYDVEATCRAMDRVPLERDFIETWKKAYRAGRLPARYRIREWQPLVDQGYR